MRTGKGGFTRCGRRLEFIKFIKPYRRHYSCQAAPEPEATSEVPYLGQGVFPEDYSSRSCLPGKPSTITLIRVINPKNMGFYVS